MQGTKAFFSRIHSARREAVSVTGEALGGGYTVEKEPRVIFGAAFVPKDPDAYHHNRQDWKIVTDPVKFALAEGDIVDGSTEEEIRIQLNAREGGESHLDWYDSIGNAGSVTGFRKRDEPRLREGADPFEAARQAPGVKIRVQGERLSAPEGADLFDGTEHGSVYLWTDGVFVFRGAGWHNTYLVFGTSEVKAASEEIKRRRRNARRRELREKKGRVYKTLPKSRAKEAYRNTVDMATEVLRGHLSTDIVVRKRHSYMQMSRGELLRATRELLELILPLRKDKGGQRYYDIIVPIFQPLHDNWDECKKKKDSDAEHVKPVLDLLFP